MAHDGSDGLGRRQADVPTTLDEEGQTASPHPIPRAIGTYRILSVLGQGGMGTVFEAEQRDPQRPVALKVVRGEQYVDDHYIRLFQREAQTLARLDHPNIAAIYEAGRTDDGHHFFAMELVRGENLNAYLRRHQLSRRERLKLFVQICDAIDYAHQRGVIHRDLKPTNILIDADGRPKVLDFGLARITASDIAKTTLLTEVGTIQGTLTHMSPEQARGNPHEIDLRSDVYSLGVILFELMTDRLPYDVERGGLQEALQTISEKEPPRPSAFARAVRGDLETIILKAMAKEPPRRYRGVAALADDVERYLADHPILARPPSTIYQLRKLVTRHKTASTFLVALFVIVLGFGIWMRVLYTRAEAEAETATWVKDFMVGLFGIADPNVTRGDQVTARDMLDQGARKVATDFDAQPEIQAELIDAIVTAYRNLSLYDEAEQLARESLEIRRGFLPDEHPAVARSLMNLGWVLKRAGDYREAEAYIREALELNRRFLGQEHSVVAENLHLLGTTEEALGQYPEARSLIAEALAIQRRLLGDDHGDVADSLVDLARVTQKSGDSGQAEELVREALRIRSVLGDDQAPRTASAKSQLASLLRERGDYAEATRVALEALAIRQHVYEESHPYVAASLAWVGAIMRDAGDTAGAERYLRDALERYQALFGEDHEHVASAMHHLAWVLFEQGAHDEAASYFERALRIYRARGVLERRPESREPELGLARIALARGRPDQAELLMRELLAVWEGAHPEGHWRVGLARSVLGDSLRALGRFEEAEELLLRGQRVMQELRGPRDRYVLEGARRIVELYEAWGKSQHAAEYRARLETP